MLQNKDRLCYNLTSMLERVKKMLIFMHYNIVFHIKKTKSEGQGQSYLWPITSPTSKWPWNL